MTDSPTLPQLARSENYDALEEQWLEACESPGEDLAPFVETVQALQAKGESKRIGMLLSLLLPNLGDKGDPQARLALLEAAAAAEPEDVGHRRQLMEAIEAAYADCEGIRAFIRAADVENAADPAGAMALMRKMMDFRVGRHVYHGAGWGAGVVKRISAATGRITIDFEHNKGHSMTLAGAPELLDVLDDDDFRAMCFDRLDEVKRMAAEDAPALFQSLLKARGGKATTKQVKIDLQGRVLSKEEWSKWWPRAKKALRHAPLIAMTGGTNPDFVLREEAITPQQEIADRFRAAQQPAMKLAIAKDALAHPGIFKGAEALLEEIASALLTTGAKWQTDSPSRWLEALLVVAKLRRLAGHADMPPGMDPKEMIASADNPAELLMGMTEDDLRRDALDLVRVIWPDHWPQVWAWMLTTPSPATCDYVVRELDDSVQTDALLVGVSAILQSPASYPDSMIWLWKRVMGDKLPIHFDVDAKIGLFEKMLRLVDALLEAGDKPALAKARNCLAANNFDPIESLAEAVPSGEGRRLHGTVSFTRGLTEAAKRTMLSIFEAAHPEAFRIQLKPWEEAVTYSTEAGLEKRREELVRLTTVEYSKITKAIGEAAERGDISDNAEFQAAIEARSQLTERATAIKAEIDTAKAITRSMVLNDEVSIGCKMHLKNLSDGSEHTFALLGPWDADPDAGILSYRAPFSQAFLGKRVGDTVEVESAGAMHRYQIVGLGFAV